MGSVGGGVSNSAQRERENKQGTRNRGLACRIESESETNDIGKNEGNTLS